MEPPAPSDGNAAVIHALFAELDKLGVQEFCVAAGARNAPLLAVLLETDRKVFHFFEERSAAFFALGRAMISRRAVAVLTTSGTAVAELFPAVMEAYYQAAPLVVVSADRPSSYRGSGAPQAVEQVGLFGSYVIRQADIEYVPGSGLRVADTASTGSGPVHFNVCLEEGALPQLHLPAPPEGGIPTSHDPVTAQHRQDWKAFWDTEGDVVVLAAGLHADDLPEARAFLLELGAPIVAEATSNLQSDAQLAPSLLGGGERALAAQSAKRVLRLGSVPSWRWWRDLDAREDVSVLSVSRAPFRGLSRTANASIVPWAMLTGRPSVQSVSPSEFFSRASSLDQLLDAFPNAEPAWMRHISLAVGEDAVIMLGNSLPIREWNLAAAAPQRGTTVFANRGANGIDGLVSTWLGLSAAAPVSWLIIGDLSTLYDLSAPWIMPQLGQGRRRIVIINNGGGMIFSRVGWLRSLSADTRQVLENSHDLSFEPWAKMWGLDYRLLTVPEDVQDDDSPAAVWEVRPDPGQSEDFWREWQKAGMTG